MGRGGVCYRGYMADGRSHVSILGRLIKGKRTRTLWFHDRSFNIERLEPARSLNHKDTVVQ